MIPAFIGALVKSGIASNTVTLSGATVLDTNTGNASAAIRIDQDGKVYSVTNSVGTTQLSSSTDWVIPRAGMTAYQVRYTNKSGAGNPTATTAEDIWHQMSTSDWTITLSTISGTAGCSFDIEIRLGTGATLASVSYTLNVDAT